MDKLFRMSSQSNRYRPPAGPPPPAGTAYANDPNAIPHGAAAGYYGQGTQPQYQAPTSTPYNGYPSGQQQFSPPPGPPPPAQGGAYQHQSNGPGGEDPLAMLSRYDTVVLVDDSGSMEMFWDETRDALTGLVAQAICYDSDGIDLHFFNDVRASTYGCRTTQQVEEIFRRVEPRRSTPTSNAMKRVLDPYLQKLYQSKTNGIQVKPMNLIVLTDGAPDRGQSPEEMIVEMGKFLDGGRYPLSQIGISFIQIGNDEEAARHLTALDDDLKTKYRIRDIVDCTPYQASDPSRVGAISADFILKALLGGVNRKIDKQSFRRV